MDRWRGVADICIYTHNDIYIYNYIYIYMYAHTLIIQNLLCTAHQDLIKIMVNHDLQRVPDRSVFQKLRLREYAVDQDASGMRPAPHTQACGGAVWSSASEASVPRKAQ